MDLTLIKFSNQLQELIQMNVIHTHLLLQRCVPSALMHTSDPKGMNDITIYYFLNFSVYIFP
jgi:hypothetical protein